jgi:hypothetical protein
MRKLAIMAAALTTLGLTAFSAPAQAKTPGPNGQIVFSRYDPAFGDDATYIMNPDGSNVRPLFPSFASNTPHWSPDGSKLAVQAPLWIRQNLRIKSPVSPTEMPCGDESG